MKKLGDSDVLRMQIIDADDNVWRSLPLEIGSPTGVARKFHVFERDENRVTLLELDSSRIDEPVYKFDDARGSVVWTDSGRHLGGIFGG
jgi:hypothetical protein